MVRPFLWGVATSAHQVEGDNNASDWWAWEQRGFIDGGARSGRATNHREHFAEDIRLTQGLGCNSYRFSIEWSRLEPREGEWNVEAFEWYKKLIHECERRMLRPCATLLHFTIPQWMAEQGGVASELFPVKFARFVEKTVEAFGPHIPIWFTLNEPVVMVVGGYLARFMPPGNYHPMGAAQAIRSLLRAHTLAYDVIHNGVDKRGRVGPFSTEPVLVGFAHNMLDFFPDRAWHPGDVLLARAFDFLYNWSWIDAVSGRPSLFRIPFIFQGIEPVDEIVGRKTYDFIGLNYYTKAYTRVRPRTHAKERETSVPFGVHFAKRRETASDLSWAVHPDGLYRILKELQRFHCPIMITENGIADGSDRLRRSYLASHLRAAARARSEGVDLIGYFHWSLIDNFEWIKGFWPRFGLVEVNYETFERTLRPSAEYYTRVIEEHGEKPLNLDSLAGLGNSR